MSSALSYRDADVLLFGRGSRDGCIKSESTASKILGAATWVYVVPVAAFGTLGESDAFELRHGHDAFWARSWGLRSAFAGRA